MLAHPVAPGQDSVRARELLRAALDQDAELRPDSALVLVRAARAADPRHLATQMRYIELMVDRGAQEELNAEYSRLSPDRDPTDRCFGALALRRTMGKDRVLALASELERQRERTGCWALLAIEGTDPRHPDRLMERLTLLSPDLDIGWLVRAAHLRMLGRGAEERRVLEEAARRGLHPLHAVHLQLVLARSYLDDGDSARSRRVRTAAELTVARDGRPGLALLLLDVPLRTATPGEQLAAQVRALEIARRAHSWQHEFRYAVSAGNTLLEWGKPLPSIPYFSRAIAIADSVRGSGLRLRAYTRRGRALVKAGRTKEAERDLLRAVRLGAPSGELYFLADAWHNLSHLYESTGDFVQASRAAQQYVDYSASFTWDAVRVGSMRDLGIIQWKAGWHAAANATFARMVTVIDQLKMHSYWAGEFFERRGDLQRARHYYQRSYAVEKEDVTQSLSGLVRAYEALGLLDSAEAYARVHDAGFATPRDVPLLPSIRARRGKVAEALATLDAWWKAQEALGNLEGAVVGALHHAELLLQAGHAAPALATATHAAALAERMKFVEERIDAIRMAGTAHAMLGSTDVAVATLRRADALARANPSHGAALRASRALGEALERSGRLDEALRAFDRSAHLADAEGGTFELDLDRARYRNRNVAPYDGALRLLIQSNAMRREVERIFDRSQRRKGTALSPRGNGPDASPGSRTTLSLVRAQRALAPDEAVLDYLMVDSVVAVTVLRRDRAATVVLPATAHTVATLARDLRKGLLTHHGGILDVSRTRFDLARSHRLYQILVAPLDSMLRGAKRLVIVPDGALHSLPFDALVDSPPVGDQQNGWDYAGTSYVLDRHSISYLPSVRFLVGSPTSRGAGLSGGQVVVVAHNGPGVAEELEAVSAAWSRGRTRMLAGSAATEAGVRRAASGGLAVLHLASHAVADDTDPLASHIELSADSSGDGLLHAGEISANRTGAQLVVLSACETVAGPLFAGEGLMGLSRAFLASGARGVVGSLWPVGSRTATFMGVFHRRLSAGEAPVTALRAAKVSMRRRAETAHPLYWAAFVLVER